MRNTMKLGATAIGAMLALAGCEGGAVDLVGEPGSLEGLATESLVEDLPYLREEEKLARDVYLRLGDRWDVPVFDKIAASEQRHTDAVRDLLAALVIEDPVTDDTVGAIADPALAALYAQLVAAGEVDEVAAYRVGATIEDLDLADIRSLAARTDVPEVLAVYARLECGSRNHLRAYVGRLADAGEAYVAAHLPQADVDAIVASPREKCGR